MASDDLAGRTYVFHLEGIMWANSLRGGAFHKPMDVVISAATTTPQPFNDVEMPIMAGFVGSQYTRSFWPFKNAGWPPIAPPPPLPPTPPPPPASQCKEEPVPSKYVPNAGFYPFTEIGVFEFLPDQQVGARIRWNFAGMLVENFKLFSGAYRFDGGDPQGPKGTTAFAGVPGAGIISVSAPNVGGSPQWDYAFLFTNLNTRAEALLMAAGRLPRPAAASGRMIMV